MCLWLDKDVYLIFQSKLYGPGYNDCQQTSKVQGADQGYGNKVIIFSVQKKIGNFHFYTNLLFFFKKIHFLEKCKIYISPSIYVNLECKFLQKCKSMENVNLQFLQPQGSQILITLAKAACKSIKSDNLSISMLIAPT